MARTHRKTTRSHRHGGFVLFAVAVAVSIVALAGLTFLTLMSNEREAADLRGRELQARALADSGEAMVRAAIEMTADQQARAGGLINNPSLFRARPVLLDTVGGSGGRFSVVAPEIRDGRVAGIRFGLIRESAKLNLAVLPIWDQLESGSARQALLRLPGMTETAADSILDWVDADDNPRQFGAELDYYRRQGLPYKPRNAPPTSLEELLLVRGVSRRLVFGEDHDLNYLADTQGTAAGAPSLSVGPASGTPWAHLLTVSSVERNATAAGTPRIYLNQPDLRQLHTQLSGTVGTTWADFVVLYRQFGPVKPPKASASDAESSGNAGRSPSGSRSGASQPSGPGEGVTIDFSVPGKVKLASPLDLVESAVRVPAPAAVGGSPPPADGALFAAGRNAGRSAGASQDRGGDPGANAKPSPITVASPIAADRASRANDVTRLLEWTTTADSPVLIGRINVNEAPRLVLEGVPGLTQSVVQQIISRRGRSVTDTAVARRRPTWLWTEGLVDLATMKRLVPLLTCGGDMYRAQIVGFFDNEDTAFTRIEIVMDASTRPASRVYFKDLTLLGRGYPIGLLLGTSADAAPAGSPFATAGP